MTLTTRFDIDVPRNAVVLRRQIPAAPAQVFDAWTKPALLSQWWDPSGAPLAECSVDLRAGGGFRLVNQGAAHAFEGRYTEIVPPTKLVFSAMGAVGTVEMQATGAGTLLVVTMVCASAEHLAQFVAMGIAEGTAQTLDNLAAHFSQ